MNRLCRRQRDSSQPALCRSSRGFALVEVAVALALGVTLLVAVQGLLVVAVRSTREVENRAAAAASRCLPLDLLQQDLQSQPAGGGLALTPRALRMTTLNALQSPCPAVRHAVDVRYAIEARDGGGLRLTRRESEPGEKSPGRTGVVIADELSEIEIAVFDGRSWRTSWPPRVSRTAYAFRIVSVWPDGERWERTIRLAPLPWSRHDD